MLTRRELLHCGQNLDRTLEGCAWTGVAQRPWLARGLFDPEEALLLQKAMETDPQVRGNLYNRNDAQGLATKMVLWKFASGSGDAFLKTFVNPPELKKTMQI
jgi:hypothetical protein